ncbi:MAG TPA: MMPL family transporter [Rhodocyclaceae bacterium]|nr:MMPL family transporter [Rhodocyclaceae bacterium]
MHAPQATEQQPVIRRLEDFDTRSGNLAERLLFNHRTWVVLFCLLGTLVLGWQATKITLNASFEKMIPTSHPFIANYLKNRADLASLGNSMRIAVETTQGTIFNKEYMHTLQKMNDEIYLLPEVDRANMKSLWTSSTRWTAVTVDGLDGGTVVPDDYDGSQRSLDQVRLNIERSGEIGQLVANNLKSSVIFVPLLDRDPQSGKPLNYHELSVSIEKIRAKYQHGNIRIHVTGFAKVMGDLISGMVQVLAFFGVAIVIAALMLFWYTRCIRSTLLVVVCSLVAVVWQFGLITLFGFELDPYSVLVPFLVFAIGMSHGAQKMNGIMQDIGRGTHRVVAARYTFRRLFLAGATALLCDAVGFGVLILIRIQVIQDLALIASTGVAILIFTNLILLPILLSYTGVGAKAAARSFKSELRDQQHLSKHWLWRFLDQFTHRRWAAAAIASALVLAGIGYGVGRHLQIGDLDPGAPELRADSRYNRDDAFMVKNYAASGDVFVVMVKTPVDHCTRYGVLSMVDDLGWQLDQLPGVDSTNSMADMARIATVGYNEGNFKWMDLDPDNAVLGEVQSRAPRELFNQDCSLLTLYVNLKDHKAQTLTRVVTAVQSYMASHHNPEAHFMLAAGNAGIAAATNIVVKKANHDMMFWVYSAVILLCWITFRSWRAVVCAVLPLILTSILGEALMVAFGMGVKVATLPVVALGVGIGVDYALYVLSIVLAHLREGKSLSEAYYQALLFTGKVVMLTGFTLAIGVATWAFSPIKFQADMGILLAFMFLWNMIGALILLPALAHFLLRPSQTEPAVQHSMLASTAPQSRGV